MRRLVPRRPILRRAPTSTHTKQHQPVSHIILNGSMHKWNPASGIFNELSDCILYRQTNGTLCINFSMFFGKLALKKHFFGSHTKICWPPPIVHNCCKIFCFFLVASLTHLFSISICISWFSFSRIRNATDVTKSISSLNCSIFLITSSTLLKCLPKLKHKFDTFWH